MSRGRTPKGPSRVTVNDSPMAITSDGDLLVNLSHSNGPADAKSLLQRALAAGGEVFVGTVVTPGELRFAKKWIDDSGAELAATIFGDRCTRTRRKAKPGS